MNLSEENKTLAQNNKALANQLDKITGELFKAQEIATDLKLQLDDKKHSEQLAGWAIDRALELAKHLTDKPQTVAALTKIANDICDGVREISKAHFEKSPRPTQNETIN